MSLTSREPTTPNVTILIADDFCSWRVQACSLLRQRPEWRVVGEAEDGLQAVQMAAVLRPDVVLLDIGMPGLNGIEGAKRIRQVSPESKIIFVTQETDIEVKNTALATGAHGYVIKSNAGSQLLTTIENALRSVLQ